MIWQCGVMYSSLSWGKEGNQLGCSWEYKIPSFTRTIGSKVLKRICLRDVSSFQPKGESHPTEQRELSLRLNWHLSPSISVDCHISSVARRLNFQPFIPKKGIFPEMTFAIFLRKYWYFPYFPRSRWSRVSKSYGPWGQASCKSVSMFGHAIW